MKGNITVLGQQVSLSNSDKKLIIDETLSLISGELYMTVKPEGYIPNWDNQTWNMMVEWCVETYGPTPTDGVWTAGARWYVNNAKFWFRERKDLEWFVLRWT